MFVDSFQEHIWNSKYRYKDEDYVGFCNRIAGNIFPNDKEKNALLFELLSEFMVLFGGRINSNIGTDEKGLTLFNCFIEALPKNPDSLQGIMEVLTNYILTLKTEGGVGFCANFFRPANTIIRKIGVNSPGPIKFLEMFDRASEVITSGSVDKSSSFQGIPTKNSIRKGATMVTMNVNHPDIEEFITAKSTPNKLTKMNMSVLVTDAFIQAVEMDADWDLWFPDINFEKYEEEWDGNFEKWAEKGYPTVIYKTIRAKELWDLLLKSSYNRNEPGILFIDNARKMDNLCYLKDCGMTSPNPCAEIFGNTGKVVFRGKDYLLGDVCNLGSINLTKFYDSEKHKFCMHSFKEAVDIMVQALDNVIEISNYPISMYENAAKLKRKIGIGLMGVGSLMMMMDIRYGSEDCLELLEPILKEFINQAYKSSALLAKEKGPYPLWDEKAMEGGFLKHSGILRPEVLNLIKKYGLRNSALSAVAPNGTLSIVAGNISGGIEPVFAREFSRWSRVEGRKVNFKYPNVHKGEWFETEYLKETIVADEKVLVSTDGRYRVDKNTGLCEQVTISDYGYKIAVDLEHENVATAMELTVEEHLKVLKLLSRYIDQAASKTINLPKDISYKEFKGLYGRIHECGIKGCTTYREGTSVAVLEADKKHREKDVKKQQKKFLEVFKDQEEDGIVVNDVRLPEEYPAKGYIINVERKRWYLHVAFKDKAMTKPFAIFVNTNSREDNVSTFYALEKLEEIARFKGLKEHFIEETKRKYVLQKNPVKICRMLGLLLRHNVDMYTIVKGLDELDADVGTFVFRIKKFLGQFIEEYEETGAICPSCGEKSIIFSEGCHMCKQCGHSKCG